MNDGTAVCLMELLAAQRRYYDGNMTAGHRHTLRALDVLAVIESCQPEAIADGGERDV